jgi:F-type H+-transporting ATPase subunit b
LEILNNLGINFKSIIIQGIGFIILLFVLKKFLFGKISAMIKERTEGIKSTYAKVESDKTEAERLKSEYQRKISEAEIEAARRIQDAVVEGERISGGIIQRAKEEVELMRVKVQESIDQERKKALAEIRNQVVTLSILASSKIIQQSISSKTAEKLVDDFIEEMGELSVR